MLDSTTRPCSPGSPIRAGRGLARSCGSGFHPDRRHRRDPTPGCDRRGREDLRLAPEAQTARSSRAALATCITVPNDRSHVLLVAIASRHRRPIATGRRPLGRVLSRHGGDAFRKRIVSSGHVERRRRADLGCNRGCRVGRRARRLTDSSRRRRRWRGDGMLAVESSHPCLPPHPLRVDSATTAARTRLAESTGTQRRGSGWGGPQI